MGFFYRYIVKNFKQYMKDNEDIEKSLSKLPEKYRKLVHGFHIKLEPGNTLHGDDGHVGLVMTNPKRQIKVAAPWNYPRSFALYHEIGHLVYEKYVRGTQLETEWSKVCKLNPNRKKDEPDDENFCHAFAAYYSEHPPLTHHHETWREFIKKLA